MHRVTETCICFKCIIINGLLLIYYRNLHVMFVYYIHWSISSIVWPQGTSRSIGILRNSTSAIISRKQRDELCSGGSDESFSFNSFIRNRINKKLNWWHLKRDLWFKITSIIFRSKTGCELFKTKVRRIFFCIYHTIYNN